MPDMLDVARYAVLVYGALMIMGGILGYVLPATPSKASLIAGCASGALAVLAFFIARSEPTPGLAIALVVSAGVAVMMVPRLKTAKKPLSTRIIIGLSAATAVIVIVALAAA
ncbi:MAG: TMEM14 family protein [Planctomycetes bacterium]|nr:TMEM14 family protein [Planctomycetota bacterium]